MIMQSSILQEKQKGINVGGRSTQDLILNDKARQAFKAFEQKL